MLSGLTFCKPCFVPSYCKRLITSYSGGNHLSTESILSFSPLNSVKKVPLPKFGFLARGVYRVPLSPFLVRLRHCGTFKDTQPYPKGRRLFSCRQPIKAALAYDFARHEHYGHLSTVRAWTFLYRFKICSDYPNVKNMNYYITTDCN